MNTTDINSEVSRRLDDLTCRLDELEERLPAIPARAIELSRATVHRVNSVVGNVANDVGRQLGRLSSTANVAASTTVGQARSAVDRTTTVARNTSKETVGQARAQGKRTAKVAEQSAATLLGDAARSIEPNSDGSPRRLDDRTKAELYERAQELEIEGRSSMTKDELVLAIRSS